MVRKMSVLILVGMFLLGLAFEVSADPNEDLVKAVRRGDIEAAKAALESGADPNVKREDYPVLMWAAQKGDGAMVQLLLLHAPDIDTLNDDGKTALICAVANNHLETVELLLKNGADANIQYTRYIPWGSRGVDIITQMNALILAIENGFFEMAKLLLEYEADIDIQDKYGRTPLIKLALHLKADKLQGVLGFLIENGANIDHHDRDGNTALMEMVRTYRAYENDGFEKIKLLLHYGADINTQDDYDRTILMKFARRGELEKVQFLVKNGADMNISDRNGRTVLTYAKNCNEDDYHEDYRKKIDCQAVIDFLKSARAEE